MENCNGDYEIVDCRKEHGRRSDWLHTPEFIHQLEKKVMENPGNGMPALSWEIGDAIFTISLNEELATSHTKGAKINFLPKMSKKIL